jgi:2-hydroxycyclohexanecarboxyl-CoA dehydrogenase
MDLGLAGKSVIVTGATANIGRAIALDMAAEGVRLTACGRDQAAGERVVREALARGAADARFVAADLLDEDAGERIARAATEAYGGVDVLVNNVGGNFVMGEFAATDPESWQKDIDITFVTVLRVTRAVLPGMIARKSGRIVNIGSTAGDVGDTFLAVYSAAKGAVHAFTRVLAKEVGQHGVTVNCVAPYFTLSDDPAALSSGSRFNPETGFFTKAMGALSREDLAKMGRTGPLDRTIAKPEEVAAAVLYLASDRAAFTTGQIVYVDGGTRL